MSIREVLTFWSGEGASGKTTVMYFDPEGLTTEAMMDAVQAFWEEFVTFQNESYDWNTPNTGRILDETTGELTGFWNSGTPGAGSGTAVAEQVADSTQVLFQWHTDGIVNGRRVQGRTFWPGLIVGAVKDGNLEPAARIYFREAAQAFLATPSGLVVWSRPVLVATETVDARPGSKHEVTFPTVWSELAVLRNRRG